MTFDLKAVARTYREVVGGEQRVFRYWNDDESVWVDIFSAADRPQDGVTTWATLGMSRFDTGYRTEDGRAIRVELIGEISATVTTFGNMLTACALNIATGGYGLDAGTIYPDIVRDYEPDVTTAHMLLTDVFSFEGLGSVAGDGEVLTFLQAVPVTDAEFEFARREGVAALTDLLEAESVDVLDLDRPSVVAGPAHGSSAPGVVYCGRWDPVQRRPVPPLDEAEARHRYVEGPTFSVVLPGDDTDVPRAVLEVDAGASRVLVTFFGGGGAVDQTRLYRRRGDRLFFEQIDTYTYVGERVGPDSDAAAAVAAAYAPAGVVRHELWWFRPDGVARQIVDDADHPTIDTESRDGVPVDDMWMAVPAFGEWDSLIRDES